MANLDKVVKVTSADYETLKNGGTVSGHTYSDLNLYLIDDDNQYAYKNINNYFTQTQTITNPDGSTDDDICISLDNNNTDFPNRSLAAFHYNGTMLGSIGAFNISGSSAGQRPVFWHPTYSFTKLLTGLDLFEDRFCAVQGDDFDSGDIWYYNGVYSKDPAQRVIGNTSLWYYFANYAYVIFELHRDGAHNAVAMPSLFFTNQHYSSTEALRIDGYDKNGTRKAVQFYWNSGTSSIVFTQNFNGGWFRVWFAVKHDENVHQ